MRAWVGAHVPADSYNDWWECVIAFAVYAYPDPYLPLDGKVGMLMTRQLLPNAKRLSLIVA